jgi:hypothetical protein
MTSQTVILRGQSQRDFARMLIDLAPQDAVVKVSLAKRTTDQNAKMWAMLSDISRAKPAGRVATPETWKALAMHACGFAVQFEMGLNGQPFPTGFRSSEMTKDEMSMLIEWLYAFGAENGVRWSDDMRAA